MSGKDVLRLSLPEARGLMLAAQGLLHPPGMEPGVEELRATIERLGAVQLDAISVVARSQYLVVWSRLGAYDAAQLDALTFPHRAVFEHWSHAASIVPMSDYAYYRPRMLRNRAHPWSDVGDWMARNADVTRSTLEAIRERGPMASADFERPAGARRAEPWDWYGPKESRRALELLWTNGDLMVHSRRNGQKVYDLRERVLAEAFGDGIPTDDDLPVEEDQLRFFVLRTVRALGVVLPSWVWDYFRLPIPDGAGRNKRAVMAGVLDALAREGQLVPATVEGLHEPSYVARERLADLERLRGGGWPMRTTLLSPFDSLIWDRARARALFGYEVCFEAYVVPAKRRYGYFCLAILHRGRLVGRLDAKLERGERRLLVRALYLEPDVTASDALLGGLADSLSNLARFVGAETVTVERCVPERLAPALAERLAGVGRAAALAC